MENHPTPDYAELYRDTVDSVVTIQATRVDASTSHGSGFLHGGHVVTNQHVVSDAVDIELRYSRGDWSTGNVRGADAYTDLAALDPEYSPDYSDPLPLAPNNPRQGERVAALGNPMGLEGSISTGVVSGVNRSMRTDAGFTIPDTVQTDAPINPGNSGGPLVNLDREVVGVNRARAGDNIGFAVSAEIAAAVIPSLVEEGGFKHSYVKIRTLDVSPRVAEANGLKEAEGLLVTDVGGGPAMGVLRGCSSAKIMHGREIPVGGDVVVGIMGREVRSHEEFVKHLITRTEPGDRAEIDVLRDGRERAVEVTLAERPSVTEAMKN